MTNKKLCLKNQLLNDKKKLNPDKHAIEKESLEGKKICIIYAT